VSSQESSPITQWREKVQDVHNKLFRGGIWTSGEDLDPSTFMTQSEATEAITSATIELIETVAGKGVYSAVCPDCDGIGSDENATFWCDRCKGGGYVWLYDELRQSLKELSE
jgi:DnaJ-class molecular chaperone